MTAHSEKEHARPTFKKGFGHHPLCAFLDHGPAGAGEALVIKLRPGNAGSNTAADHIDVAQQALAQLPGVNASRPGKRTLIRTGGVGGTHEFIDWLTRRRLAYPVGFTLSCETPALYKLLPEAVWTPAYDTDRQPRDGADAAEFTGIMDLKGWPAGMRVIVRRERPHPGTQLRFEDVDGYRLAAFVTNTTCGQLPDLELRHRRRARCEDRIRLTKDTGLRNLPLHGYNQNRIWCQLVTLATEVTARMGLLATPPEPPAGRNRNDSTALTTITRLRALPTAPGQVARPPSAHDPEHDQACNPAPRERHADHCHAHTTKDQD